MQSVGGGVAGKKLRIFLNLLCIAAVGLWIFWYLFMSSLACAFGSLNGPCKMTMPWQMNSEDLMVFIGIPGILVLLVFALTRLIAQATRSDKDK